MPVIPCRGGGRPKGPVREFAYGARVGEVPQDPITPLAEGVTLTVPHGRKVTPRRRMMRKLPFGSVKGIPPFVRDSNDINTQVDGLTRRLGRSLPPIDPIILAEFTAFVAKWIRTHLNPIPAGGLMTFKEWLDSTNYTGSRKAELERIYVETHACLPNREERRKIMGFIKSESMLIGNVFKSARWICSRKDKCKVVLGPIFKTIEHIVYGIHNFIKHTPVPERPSKVSGLRAAGMKYIVTDYTAYESSFDPRIMKACEVAMYRYMLTSYPELAEFVDDTITGTNEITTRLGVKVTVQGRRMSGDMCTSLGNGFTNLMLMSFFTERLGSTFDGFVEGDDGIFAINGRLPTKEMFASLGFSIKLQEIPDPCLGGFCGVVANGNDVMRDPVKFLQTFGWTCNSIDGGNRVMMGLLRAKALSALYETPVCPIVSAVAQRALDLTMGFDPRWSDFDVYHQAPPKFVPVHREIPDTTRDLFSRLYGVGPAEQKAAETRIMTSHDLSFIADFIPHHPNHGMIEAWFIG